jgi:ribonuclease HI
VEQTQQSLRCRFEKKELRAFRSLPCLIIWGIWLARNAQLFEDRQVPTFQVYSQVYVLFQNCRTEVEERNPRQIGDLLIDKSSARDFFDGPPDFCSTGETLFISDRHFIKFKAGLGPGTNNSAELMALRCLLKLAFEKGATQLQVFGNSSLAINWIKGDLQVQNVLLRPLAEQLKEVANLFEQISFTHVFRELNTKADGLSKDGQQVAAGTQGSLHVEESLDRIMTFSVVPV